MDKVNMVYFSGGYVGEKKSVSVVAAPHEFSLLTRARWEMLISNENKEVRANETQPIDIRPVKLMPEEVCILCPIVRNGLGVVVGIGGRGAPKLVENTRLLDYVVFTAINNGEVSKNDLLGVINIFPTFIRLIRPPPEKVEEREYFP
jgi:hypothetical protein